METNQDKTTAEQEKIPSSGEALRQVYNLLKKGGYDPIGQIVGYLLSEDPTYITNIENARKLIRYIDRDEMMNELLLTYFGDNQ